MKQSRRCPLSERCQRAGAAAQVMRHDVALALGKSGPNVDVMCTDKAFGGRFMPFAKVGAASPHTCRANLAKCASVRDACGKTYPTSVLTYWDAVGSTKAGTP